MRRTADRWLSAKVPAAKVPADTSAKVPVAKVPADPADPAARAHQEGH